VVVTPTVVVVICYPDDPTPSDLPHHITVGPGDCPHTPHLVTADVGSGEALLQSCGDNVINYCALLAQFGNVVLFNRT